MTLDSQETSENKKRENTKNIYECVEERAGCTHQQKEVSVSDVRMMRESERVENPSRELI
jgi:hypothetical protein